MTSFAAAIVAACSACSSLWPVRNAVSGEVWTDAGFNSALFSNAQGLSPAVARSFDQSGAKGSYSAAATTNGVLPHFTISAISSRPSSGATADVSANYFSPEYLTISGLGGAAPTTAVVHWVVAGSYSGTAYSTFFDGYGSWQPNSANAQNVPGSKIHPQVSYSVDPATGATLYSGTATEELTIGSPNSEGIASAYWAIWAQADAQPGEAVLDMLANEVTFPEFGDRSAEDLGWTLAFATDAPTTSPPPSIGGEGPMPTPEPTACLIWAAAGLIVARRNAVRRTPLPG